MRPLQASFIEIRAGKPASARLFGSLEQCPDICKSGDTAVDFFSCSFDHLPHKRIHLFFQEHINADRPVTARILMIARQMARG